MNKLIFFSLLSFNISAIPLFKLFTGSKAEEVELSMNTLFQNSKYKIISFSCTGSAESKYLTYTCAVLYTK